MDYEGPIQDLITELGRLPGIGPKSAQRIAFHLLKMSVDDAGRHREPGVAVGVVLTAGDEPAAPEDPEVAVAVGFGTGPLAVEGFRDCVV